jgi:hypothetical protein
MSLPLRFREPLELLSHEAAEVELVVADEALVDEAQFAAFEPSRRSRIDRAAVHTNERCVLS